MTLLLMVLTAGMAWAANGPIGSIQYNESIGAYEINCVDNLIDLSVLTRGKDTYTTGEYNSGYDNKCEGMTFKVTADIDFHPTTAWNDATSTENNFTPLGSTFKGTFDGQGHTISGIRIYDPEDYYVGIFGSISGGTVKNIILADTRLTASCYVGGIAGINRGKVENCHVLSTVAIHGTGSDDNESEYHGGIAGTNTSFYGNNGWITECTSAATLTIADGLSSRKCYGGIAGANESGAYIYRCLAVGVTVPSVTNRGAAIGETVGPTGNNFYSQCSVAGSIVSNMLNSGEAILTVGKDITADATNKLFQYINVTSKTDYSPYYVYASGATVTLTYTGTVPTGYKLVFTVTKDADHSTVSGTESNGTYTFEMPDGNVTAIALLTPIIYTISYDLAGGTLVEGVTIPATYNIESETFTLVNPTREGYDFAGWTGDGLEGPTTTVSIEQGSTENRSYTATWTPITYTISYDLAGGTLVEGVTNPTTYNIESEAFTLNNPTREGYNFTGWAGTGIGVVTPNVTIAKGSTGNRTYTAMWNQDPPTGLAVSDITANSAMLSWMGESNAYVVKYRTAAYMDGIQETFDTYSTPTGWENKEGKLSSDGTVDFSGYSGWSFGAYNGVFDNQNAQINICSTKYGWLITPLFTVGEEKTLSFDLALTNWSGNNVPAPDTHGSDDRFAVLVTTDNEATWTILRQWDNAGSQYVYNNIACSATGEKVSIDLSAYQGYRIRIAFYGESLASNADNNLHIDNVSCGKAYPAGEWQSVTPFWTTAELTGLTGETLYEASVQSDYGLGSLTEASTVTFTTLPACPVPTSLAVSDVQVRSAVLTWESDATSWEICVNNDMDHLISTTEKHYTFTGLTPETYYNVRVRAVYSSEGTSKWSFAKTFTTGSACLAPTDLTVSDITTHTATLSWTGGSDSYVVSYKGTEILLNVDFEDNALPTGWTSEGNSTWSVGTGDHDSSTGAHGGSYNARITHSNRESATYLVTPAMNLSGKNSLILHFWYVNRAWGSDSDEFCVYYRVDGGSWKELWRTTEEHFRWTEASIPLTGLADNYQIGFKMTDNYGYGVGIDDIIIYKDDANNTWKTVEVTESTAMLTGLTDEAVYEVKVQGNCGNVNGLSNEVFTSFTTPSARPVPTVFGVTGVTHSSAVLTWKSDAASWQVCINGDMEHLISVTEKPYTLTGLTPETQYAVKVRACYGEDVYSVWTEENTFTTIAPPMAIGDGWNDDFEGDVCGWTFVNGDRLNAWAWGTATHNGDGDHALYISEDGGTSNEYANGYGHWAMVFATKFLSFTAGRYTFTYDWKANGNENANLRVALVPATTNLVASSYPPSVSTNDVLPDGWIALDGGNTLNGVTEWQQKTETVTVPAGDYFLTLAWRNMTGGGQPPAAVDNISIAPGMMELVLNDSEKPDGQKNVAMISECDNITTTVTLSGYTLYKDGQWNTLCLPFDLTLKDSPLAGAVARPLAEAGISDNSLSLTFGAELTDGTLKAGTPYIIKWNENQEHPTIDNPTFTDVTIDKTDRSYDNGVSNSQRVRCFSNYTYTTLEDNDQSILLLGATNNRQQLFSVPTGDNTALGAFHVYVKMNNARVGDISQAASADNADGTLTLTVPVVATPDEHTFAFADGQEWTTWCDDWAWTKPAGITAYTIGGVSGTTVSLTAVEGNVIPAYTPLLLQKTGDDVTAIFSSVGTGSGLVSTAGTGCTFWGNPTEDQVTEGYGYTAGQTYVLLDDNFVLADADNGLAVNSCLLTLSEPNGAPQLLTAEPSLAGEVNDIKTGTLTGGTLLFFNSENFNYAITRAAGGSTVYVQTTADYGHTHKGMTITVEKTVGTHAAQARRNAPAVGVGIEVTSLGNGRYSFVMPKGTNVNVSATFPAMTTATVSYTDNDGQSKTATAWVLDGVETKLGKDGKDANGQYYDAWYVAQPGTDLAYTSKLTLYGNVHLILADNATMDVKTSGAIESYSGNLAIYGQSTGTGKLTITAGSYPIYLNHSSLSISHCQVNVQGSYYGFYVDQNTTIDGGEVVVTGSDYCGIYSAQGSIIISNSKVTAQGKSYGLYANNNITIDGGEIEATGPDHCGIYASHDNLTISNSKVNAQGGNYGLYANSNITIDGGEVEAIGPEYGGIYASHDNLTISNSKVNAQGGNYGLYADSDLAIIGGQVVATATNTGTGYYGIYSSIRDITLDLTNATDYITASSYHPGFSNAVKIVGNKSLLAYDSADENETSVSAIVCGSLDYNTPEFDGIAGKTLRPLSGYYVTTAPYITVSGKTPDFTITTGEGATAVTTPYYIYDKYDEVTLSYSRTGYDCTYLLNGIPVEGNSFSMPPCNVNITGEWTGSFGSKPGDANGDGKVTVTDIAVVVNHILQLPNADFSLTGADANGDGEVTVTDIGVIVDIILGNNADANANARYYNNVEPQ